MSVVDKLVLLDDVNFINRGWINRNRIAVNGEPYWMTLPLIKASQNRLINEIEIFDDSAWKRKILRTVELSYRQAPCFAQVFPLFSELIEQARGPLASFLSEQLARMAAYIGLDVQMEKTSSVYPKEGRTGEERILDICRREQAESYVNLPGGRDLYDRAAFSALGIKLLFVDPNFEAMTLRHGGKEGPYLSILDLVMFNSPATVRDAIGLCRAAPP